MIVRTLGLEAPSRQLQSSVSSISTGALRVVDWNQIRPSARGTASALFRLLGGVGNAVQVRAETFTSSRASTPPMRADTVAGPRPWPVSQPCATLATPGALDA